MLYKENLDYFPVSLTYKNYTGRQIRVVALLRNEHPHLPANSPTHSGEPT